MTQKFGRNYRLTIDPKDGGEPIVVTMPFTVQFWVQRNTLSDLNHMSIDIYNLSDATRSRIFQDIYDMTENRTVVFEAGYGTLYRVFLGRIIQASSAREGTNIITRIEAMDGHFDVAASQVFQTLQGGQTLGSVLKFLIGQFPTLTLGAIGQSTDTLSRPVVLNGNTWDLLKQYSPGDIYIDGGRVYMLRNAETLPASAITILNDSTGLLGTPRREQGVLTVETLLETGIDMAQVIQLQSSVQKVYNGSYKVIGIMHQGMISGAVCGRARSIFTLQAPNQFGKYITVQ